MKSPLQTVGCSLSLAATLLSAIATLNLGMASVAEAAPRPKGWVKVLTDERERIWYVDSGSIQRKGNIRYFWSYILGGDPFPVEGKLAYSTAFYLSVDCQQKRYRMRFARAFDENNQVVKEYNYGDDRPLGSTSAGTGEDASLKYVCSRR